MSRRQDLQPKILPEVACGDSRADEAERFNAKRDNWLWRMNVGKNLCMMHGHHSGAFFLPPCGSNDKLVAGTPHIVEIPFILSSMQYLASPVNDYMHLIIRHVIDDLEYVDPGGIQPNPGNPEYVRGRVEATLKANGKSLVLYSGYEDGGTAKYAADPRNVDQEQSIDATNTVGKVKETLTITDVQLPNDMQPGVGEYFTAVLELKYYDFMLTRPVGEVYQITDPNVKYLGIGFVSLGHYNPSQ